MAQTIEQTVRTPADMLRFTAPDGRRLAYFDTGGAKPPVLCLAGLSRNSRDFSDLAAALAPTHRVIRLDSRGRGGSERAVDPHSEYSVPVEAGDAVALMDHLSLTRAHLIGTSRGGILSMAIAGGQPERVASVVLNDIGAVVEGRGLLRILSYLGRGPAAPDFETAAKDLQKAHRRDFPDVPIEEWRRQAHRLYDDLGGRPTLAYDQRLRLAVGGAIDIGEEKVRLWPLFEALKDKPVLVIRGENSDVLSTETLDEMRAAHPNMTALTLAGRGHAPFLNEPDAVAAIRAHLARADAA
ncbi:MAG: alpha/beta hydrolase [Pseudomonadota bacterium]